jgi:hypothetical protein
MSRSGCSCCEYNRLTTVLAYRLLLAGRMLLAVLLASRLEEDQQQNNDASMAIQAVSVLLRHLATALPTALGAAEVFDETCRGALSTLPVLSCSLSGRLALEKS